MGKNWSIKVWIALLVNVLLLMTTVALSLFFYREFEKSLNERVLLQLTSIKRLKRIQIEDYLEREWQTFNDSQSTAKVYTKEELESNLGLEVSLSKNVYDLSNSNQEGFMELAFVKRRGQGFNMYRLQGLEIQKILLERTGMGQSGESYIVGSDFTLRSKSRFFPEKRPSNIVCDTDGVRLALSKGEGRKLITDYREVPVFSAFHSLQFKGLQWVILSEIDQEEVLKPLGEFKEKLFLIFLSVLFLGFIATLILTSFLTQPLNKMKDYLSEMAEGNYNFSIDDSLIGNELIEMYEAFKQSVNALRASVSFSEDIGNLKLDGSFKPYSENDILGNSLITMRDKLKAFTEKEESRQLIARKALIDGEENERQRLARELHDGIGPMLTSLKLHISEGARSNKEEVKKLIDDTVEEVRRITFNLLPQSLLDFGLKEALANYIRMVKNLTEAELTFMYHENKVILNKQLKICVFRLAQEALNNALKHSKATHITLVITEEVDSIDFYYADDGVGFEMATLSRKSGLSNMEARVESLSGSFHVTSSTDGTTVQAIIPYSNI